MITVTIQRKMQNRVCTQGTFKAVSDKKPGEVTGYTLEPPDQGNGNNISCVLPDTYKAKLYYSPRFKTTVILLEDKHGRKWIEIHPGNYPDNTQGCILVGTTAGENAVWKSRDKLKELIKFIGGDEITVIIKEVA